MKEPHVEGVATHDDPESCAVTVSMRRRPQRCHFGSDDDHFTS